ncbi:hypothetical protein VTL71DRAFT_10050 [Oculimacula yallundae]|uniref:2EXR domain-containing protein n=1 Tax=Oculimacula yallundae TaxID=86028 RepID=A0ABR4BQD0_9HELO
MNTSQPQSLPFPSSRPDYVGEEYRRLTTNLRGRLASNVKTADYIGMRTSERVFTCFAKLPPSIRRRIWRHELPGTRIIELQRKKESDTHQSSSMPCQYVPKNPPPLLQTCRESRAISLWNHQLEKQENNSNKVPSCKWIRYDVDIVHLRDFEFSERIGGFLAPPQDRKKRKNSNYISPTHIGRPDCFNYIEDLAVSRDLFSQSEQYSGYLIRYFFPKPRLFILLIDDIYDIETFEDVWGIACDLDGVIKRYEKLPRTVFVKNCTGPFTTPENNQWYANHVAEEIGETALEQSDWTRGYRAPEIIALSASLPPGDALMDCGRCAEGYDPAEYYSDAEAEYEYSDASSSACEPSDEEVVRREGTTQEFVDDVHQLKAGLESDMQKICRDQNSVQDFVDGVQHIKVDLAKRMGDIVTIRRISKMKRVKIFVLANEKGWDEAFGLRVGQEQPLHLT